MPTYVYVSLQGEDKILRFTMDPGSGKLTQRHEIEVSGGPAPLAIDSGRRFLYAGRRGEHLMSSFEIDPRSGDLSISGTVPLEGEPCYIATDRSGKFLLSAYYQAGKAAVHPLDGDGALGDPAVQWIDTATGAHCFQTDPSNSFAFVPHIAGNGPNAIFQFRFDDRTGEATPNDPPRVSPEQADGPRHFCFHPRKDILYCSNEQGCSVTSYAFAPASGTLTALQTVSTLPDDYSDRSTCAQIQITASGKFLYAPNRGHDSIACFTVDDETGRLTPTGRVATEAVPRAFSLDPAGSFLFVAGRDSGRLAAYRVDSGTGALTPLETYPLGEIPMWVLITTLP